MAILKSANCYRADTFYLTKSHRHSFFRTLFKAISNTLMLSTLILSALVLSACQTIPSFSNPVATQVPNAAKVSTPTNAANRANEVDNEVDGAMSSHIINDIDNDDYPIEPYIPPQVSDNSYSIPSIDSDSGTVIDYNRDDSSVTSSLPEVIDEPEYNPPVISSSNNSKSQVPEMPSHDELLQRARQNSQQQSRQSTSSNDDLPAFRNLMQVGTNQLQAGDLTAAENSFTRAQRLAPRSSAVYFYLSQVALKKNQPRKAEAMARRGLSVSQDASRRQALWQLILKSGQIQNNTRVIREAQQALR